MSSVGVFIPPKILMPTGERYNCTHTYKDFIQTYQRLGPIVVIMVVVIREREPYEKRKQLLSQGRVQ